MNHHDIISALNILIESEIISAKEIIGTVGETGRVTGPHLHWEIYFLGETIDPAIFINSFQGP